MADQAPYHKQDLSKLSIPELERAVDSGSLDLELECEALRILRERHAAPDRTLQLWILAVAIAGLVVALLHLIYNLTY